MGRKAKTPKAPYIPKGWLKNFFNLVKRVRLQEVNRSIVKQYDLTAEGNESKLVSALKFLKIIDESGKIDENKITNLKMQGDSSKKALDKLTHEAYAEVFQTLDVNLATSTDLMNYFIGRYNYSQSQARSAAILFVFLCAEADITISHDLLDLNKQKVRFKPRIKYAVETVRTKKTRQQTKQLPYHAHVSSSLPLEKEGYVVIIRGQDFSINKTLKTSEDLDLLIKTLEINCKFEKKDSKSSMTSEPTP